MGSIKGRIIIYSIIGCPHCMAAKNTLNELNLPFTDVGLDSFPQCRNQVIERTGRTSVPQIFFNNIYVGGNEEFQKLVKERDRFKELLDEVRNNPTPPEAPVPPDPSTSAKASGEDVEFVCEPDEYAELVRELKASGLIKDHRTGLIKLHKNSFSGKEFVDWVVNTKHVGRERALEMGRSLIELKFGHHVNDKVEFKDDGSYYRLLEDDQSSALNAGLVSDCQTPEAAELSERLRKLILSIYNDHLSSDGKKVDYKAIAGDKKFEQYIKMTGELSRLNMDSLSREEKLAFFINIYNALVIHANVKVGPPTNIWERYKFFNVVSYVIGGNSYSLQDIENGVLRANRKGVGMFTRPFSKSDPRLRVALPHHEPLIHFALVCGAKSCPPIKTYSADDIDSQLSLAAQSFLESEDGCRVVNSHKEIHLSMIFKWYREDFGSNNTELVQWIHDHMPEGEKKKNMGELINTNNFKVKFMNYDWSSNST